MLYNYSQLTYCHYVNIRYSSVCSLSLLMMRLEIFNDTEVTGMCYYQNSAIQELPEPSSWCVHMENNAVMQE